MVVGISMGMTTNNFELTDEAMALGEAIMRVHGPVRWARESSGLHLYCASPEALVRDGVVELDKLHCAINVDKYLATGRWGFMRRNMGKRQMCARCMKYAKSYKVMDLMSMPPVEDRIDTGPLKVHRELTTGARPARTVKDANGNDIPEMPVDVTRLYCLPDGHPALTYLEGRGLDLARLDQYDVMWCENALPESRAVGRWYTRLPLGFCKTPAQRILMPVWHGGVRRGWQARVLDREIIDHAGVRCRQYWHWQRREWVTCEVRDSLGAWQPVPSVLESPFKWDMPKYLNATGMTRDWLMGFDVAVKWCQQHGCSHGILVEGPVDMYKFGPPAMTLMGFPTESQMTALAGAFSEITMVRDMDDKGAKAAERASTLLRGKVFFDTVGLADDWVMPDGSKPKDVGDLTSWQIQQLRQLCRMPA